MSHNKISVMILGNMKSLKKALITNILGKDLSVLTKKKILKNTEIYDDDTFEFTCTPDLSTTCDDIRELFSKNPNFDLCLLVVEDGFSTGNVQKQIKDLNKKTGKPREELTVVLPLRYKFTEYPFKFYTLEQVFSKLSKLLKDKQLMPTNRKKRKRPADTAEPQDGSKKKEKLTSTKVNLVLLGLAGTGKSASGNTILRKKHFVSKPSSNPVTTECQVEETEINDLHVRVIDTPDMFDDDTEPSVQEKYVKRCKELCESELCVFVLVMHVSRFTDGERDILKKLENTFGTKVKEQTVILFTRGDDLEEADMTLEDFLHSCQPGLKEIIEKCDNRCVLFENRSSSSDQVEKLMNTVSVVLKKTAKIQ
uniref:AIG1-type G domain-containing protein n=1 Tax=Astatotilapia calliptera TaxID=8154 RepID=A0A3P8QZX9_ASTCA